MEENYYFYRPMKQNFSIKRVIVFSQWSRKSYAIFASLGKVIKIGKVSADISDKALNKSAQPRTLNRVNCLKKQLSDLLEELRQAEGIPNTLIKQLILFMTSQVLVSSAQKGGKGEYYLRFKKQSPCFIFYKAWTFLFYTI